MAKIIPLRGGMTGNYKETLINAVKNDASLVEKVSAMSEEQAKEAYELTQGTLLEFTDIVTQMQEIFNEFMRNTVSQSKSLLIINAAIDYIIAFSEQVKPSDNYSDPIENAHAYVMHTEMMKMISKAIDKVAKKEE